jgi:pimeloyl-ACP methyl ester carboxylesterase
MLHMTVQLKDGRLLAYLVLGNPSSTKVVIQHHGFPSSKQEGLIFHEKAGQKDLKLVCVDRPGYGDSDVDVEHTIKKFVTEDLVELVGALVPKPTQISMLGVSGGGPYVASSLVYWPTIAPPIKSAIFCASMLPFDPKVSTLSFKFRMMFSMFGWSWYALYPMFSMQAYLMKSFFSSYLEEGAEQIENQASIKNKMKSAMTTVDFEALEKPTGDYDYFRTFMLFLRDAYKHPDYVNVFIRQAWQYSNDPGWRMSEIKTNAKVMVFQGGLDTQVPSQVGELIAAEIPGAELKLFPEEGHVSIMINQQDAILDACL